MATFILIAVAYAIALWLAVDFVWFFTMDYLDQRNRNLTPKQAFLVAWRNV